MEIKNILVRDDKGQLAEEAFKLDPSLNSLSVKFDPAVTDTRVLTFKPDNVDFASIPNINPSTYQIFLTYNGSLGYTDRIFSTVIEQDSGVFDTANIPETVYNPNDVNAVTDSEVLQDVVVEISMFNGVVDVLNYSEGHLNVGNKDYIVKSRRAFPTYIHTMPNVSLNRVFLDGWYSYTMIVYRDSVVGDAVVKDSYYAVEGFIFKASKDGILGYDAVEDKYYIDTIGGRREYEVENHDYEGQMFQLNNSSGLGGQAGTVFLHSQVLITDDIRDAIIAEVVEIACQNISGCEFMDWQKLTMKRMAAYVMFENGMYEKAQVIIESARKMCLNNGMGANFRCFK